MGEQKHWIESDTTRKKFWAYAKGDLGLNEDEVHDALGVASTKQFDGDKTAAMALLQNYAAGIVPRRERLLLDEQEAVHAEARVVAFCDLYAPNGTKVALTAREGAKPDDLVATALALLDASEALVNMFGFSPVPQKYTNNNNGQPKKPTTPTRPTPPPPPAGARAGAPGKAPPPPPAQPPAPPAENGQAQSGVIQAEFVRITAPKGKPVVEFWRPNRQYAEIRWQLGGEKLLALAPTLKAANWQVTHFGAEAVGEEYQLPVNVHWTPSKCGKYKDITKVVLR